MGNKSIVAINEVDFGSTGGIAIEVLNELTKEGFDTFLACHESLGRFDNEYIINRNKIGYLLNKILSRLDASDGFHSKRETRKLVKFLEEKKPDVLLLHNLHGSYINLEILFNYIKSNNIKCIWTLHDCWTFTGKCSHFTAVKCDKWKTGCHNCPNLKQHPRAYFFDHSKKLYSLKKNLFEGMEKFITFVSPSKFLDESLSKSFLRNFKHVVINNGVDINTFKKVSKENFSKPSELEGKKVILCVANIFDDRKGINDILKLSTLLNLNERILLIGDLKKKVKLSHNIYYIKHTNDMSQLINIYSWSDVFFNPTYEDTYPTVNLEATSCALPIVAYLSGGAGEVVDKRFVVQPGDVVGAYNIIKHLFLNRKEYIFTPIEDISSKKMLKSYIKLIKEVSNK